jgi:hypothetical protein
VTKDGCCNKKCGCKRNGTSCSEFCISADCENVNYVKFTTNDQDEVIMEDDMEGSEDYNDTEEHDQQL